MKKEELKASFDCIKPAESAKKRMLQNILNQYERKGGIFMPLNIRRAIPAFAIVVVLAGGLLTYNNLRGNINTPPYEYNGNDRTGTAREDAVAPILNQFQIGNRHYIILTDDLREEYGLPAVIDKNDIGGKIADINTSPDSSLIGSEVYSYIPAGGEAVVAVKKDNQYRLFRFFTFESYNNNQDEDAVEYLKLYGINKASDIAKIQFIRHWEQNKLQDDLDIIAEITDRDEINSFYNFYSVLKDSSDRYFDSLFNFNSAGPGYKGIEIQPSEPNVPRLDLTAPDNIGYGTDLPFDEAPEQAETAYDLPISSHSSPAGSGMVDMGRTGSGFTEPSSGAMGDALANPITIRIYNQNGIYYDSPYYRNIGFISRYEVNEDFREFIGKYLEK